MASAGRSVTARRVLALDLAAQGVGAVPDVSDVHEQLRHADVAGHGDGGAVGDGGGRGALDVEHGRAAGELLHGGLADAVAVGGRDDVELVADGESEQLTGLDRGDAADRGDRQRVGRRGGCRRERQPLGRALDLGALFGLEGAHPAAHEVAHHRPWHGGVAESVEHRGEGVGHRPVTAAARRRQFVRRLLGLAGDHPDGVRVGHDAGQFDFAAQLLQMLADAEHPERLGVAEHRLFDVDRLRSGVDVAGHVPGVAAVEDRRHVGHRTVAAKGVGEATLELRQLLGRDAAEVVRLALFEIERHDELVVDRQPGGLARGEVGPHDPPAVPGVVHDHCVVRGDRGDETLETVEDPGAGGVLAGAHLDVAEPAASEHLGHQGDVGVAAGESVGLAADEHGAARAGALRRGLVPHPDSVPSGGLAAPRIGRPTSLRPTHRHDEEPR